MAISLKTLIFLLCWGAICPLHAQPVLQFPLACTLGEDCWTVNYVDTDPQPRSFKDFRCGSRSYDDHKGTDFAVRDWATMEKGIPVLAAADGKVLRIRDGVKDKILSREELKKVLSENRGCGNGVVIQHREGWQTIYCHMKQGSIVAEKGKEIKAGDKIGEVGQTGYAEFPHLHIGVFYKGQVVDPYTGRGNQQGCNGIPQSSLWVDNTLSLYEPVSIYATGFQDQVPDFRAIGQNANAPSVLSTNISALTFWVGLFGVMKDDRIKLTITSPGGDIFASREIDQEKTRARQFYYVGKKTRSKKLIVGTYIGKAELTRTLSNGEVIKRVAKKELYVKQ